MHYLKTREDYLHLHPWGVSCLQEPPSEYGYRYMDLREDFIFKHILGQEPRKHLLIDLVNALSEGRRHIRDLHYGSVERQGETKETRKTIYDIQCSSDSKEQFLIEMQRQREEGFFRRMLYYGMRLGSQQVPSGKEGDNYPLPPICAIAIIDFDPWKDIDLPPGQGHGNEYLNAYQLINPKGGHFYPSKFELMLVELPKFNKEVLELQTRLDKWLYLMKSLSKMKQRLSSFDDPIFREIFQLSDYNKLNKEDKMTIDYERKRRNIAKCLREDSIEEGLRKGRIEGRTTGREEGKLEFVQYLIKKTTFDNQEIASETGVSESVVRRVRSEMICV